MATLGGSSQSLQAGGWKSPRCPERPLALFQMTSCCHYRSRGVDVYVSWGDMTHLQPLTLTLTLTPLCGSCLFCCSVVFDWPMNSMNSESHYLKKWLNKIISLLLILLSFCKNKKKRKWVQGRKKSIFNLLNSHFGIYEAETWMYESWIYPFWY